MSENPVFDPTRSKAIREILFETVASDAVTRRRRLRFMFITILTAVAVALAGGTAALALSGLPPFGPPAPAPQVPTPTGTPSPTPTPTPTPTVPAVQVSTIPVVPHDVDALSSQPGWSLDLPGTAEICEQHDVYTIADGLALFQVGSKVAGDDARGCNPDADYESLTLVNTRTGDVVWTREWKWAHGGNGTQLLVLGTSGRALITTNAGSGPSEVFDLASGRAVGAFTPPRTTGEYLRVQPTQDASGDVIMGYRAHDQAGAVLPYSELSRFDPLDVAHPIWTTRVDTSTLGVDAVTNGSRIGSLQYLPPGSSNGYVSASFDLATGAITASTGDSVTTYYSAITVRTTADPSYTTQTLTGFDDDGAQKWVMHIPYKANVSQVMSSSAAPGRSFQVLAGTTFLVVGDVKTIRLIDQRSGDMLWSADASGCGLTDENYMTFPYQLSDAGNAIVLHWGDTACAFSTDSGARMPSNGVPVSGWTTYGVTNEYVVRPAGAAYDATSGAKLWSRPVAANERWMFAGGYLVSMNGNHVEQIH